MGRATLSNAAVITDDYFSAILTLGRRVGIHKDESFLVNAKHSRSALAVIDVAVKVFGAKVLTTYHFCLLEETTISLAQRIFSPIDAAGFFTNV